MDKSNVRYLPGAKKKTKMGAVPKEPKNSWRLWCRRCGRQLFSFDQEKNGEWWHHWETKSIPRACSGTGTTSWLSRLFGEVERCARKDPHLHQTCHFCGAEWECDAYEESNTVGNDDA